VLVSVEVIVTKQSSQVLQNLYLRDRVICLVLDEVHVIKEWYTTSPLRLSRALPFKEFRGESFRPAYEKVPHVRSALVGVPVLAITATATAPARQDLQSVLGMGTSPLRLHELEPVSCDRPNIFYTVLRDMAFQARHLCTACVMSISTTSRTSTRPS
jgi:hypothetical protein